MLASEDGQGISFRDSWKGARASAEAGKPKFEKYFDKDSKEMMKTIRGVLTGRPPKVRYQLACLLWDRSREDKPPDKHQCGEYLPASQDPTMFMGTGLTLKQVVMLLIYLGVEDRGGDQTADEKAFLKFLEEMYLLYKERMRMPKAK